MTHQIQISTPRKASTRAHPPSDHLLVSPNDTPNCGVHARKETGRAICGSQGSGACRLESSRAATATSAACPPLRRRTGVSTETDQTSDRGAVAAHSSRLATSPNAAATCPPFASCLMSSHPDSSRLSRARASGPKRGPAERHRDPHNG